MNLDTLWTSDNVVIITSSILSIALMGSLVRQLHKRKTSKPEEQQAAQPPNPLSPDNPLSPLNPNNRSSPFRQEPTVDLRP